MCGDREPTIRPTDAGPLSLPGGGERAAPFSFGVSEQDAKSPAMTTHEAPSLASTILSGLLGRCPACGRGRMFSGYLTLAPRCNSCGLDYSFADSGDGPAVFVILVTGFIVVGAALYRGDGLRAALLAARGSVGASCHPAAIAALAIVQGRAHRAPVQEQGARRPVRLGVSKPCRRAVSFCSPHVPQRRLPC